MLPTYDHQLHLSTAGSPTATGEADQAGAADQRADHDLCEAGVGGRVHGTSFGKCEEDDTTWLLLRIKRHSILRQVPPSVPGLIAALESKYKISASNIRYLYRKTRLGVNAKIDDDMLRFYSNEDVFLMQVRLIHLHNANEYLDLLPTGNFALISGYGDRVARRTRPVRHHPVRVLARSSSTVWHASESKTTSKSPLLFPGHHHITINSECKIVYFW